MYLERDSLIVLSVNGKSQRGRWSLQRAHRRISEQGCTKAMALEFLVYS